MSNIIDTQSILDRNQESNGFLSTLTVSVHKNANMDIVKKVLSDSIAYSDLGKVENPAQNKGTFTFLFYTNCEVFVNALVVLNIPFTLTYTPYEE